MIHHEVGPLRLNGTCNDPTIYYESWKLVGDTCYLVRTEVKPDSDLVAIKMDHVRQLEKI